MLAKYPMGYLPGMVLISDTVEQLQSLLDGMIPRGVSASAGQITDQEESFEYPEEAQGLVKAVPKRCNEFIVGRRCARTALAQMGIEPKAMPPDERRVPQWPVGTVGSISHSIGLCCAVASRSNTVACLGVDLETTTRISSGVIERVLHPLEVDFVSDDKGYGSLIFSAKEAFFKAQYPFWEAWPNFEDLAFQVDTSTNRLNVIEVAAHLPSGLRSATGRMQFRYAFFDNYVLTLCWLNSCSS